MNGNSKLSKLNRLIELTGDIEATQSRIVHPNTSAEMRKLYGRYLELFNDEYNKVFIQLYGKEPK
jgi:hypothetical protein